MPARVDWLARRQGGIVDFRLPSDRYDIPSAVLRDRILEYYRQLRATAAGAGQRDAEQDDGGQGSLL